jgi:cell division protein FtsQ
MSRTRRNRRKPPQRELPRLPSIPRPVINWRGVFAFFAVCAMAFASIALARELLELPVRKAVVGGSLQRVTIQEILAAAELEKETSFLSLDLEAIRSRVAAVDWVDSVTLQRVWPDTLRITVTEHLAAARWGEGGLLDTNGELFAEDARSEYLELPRLDGPDGSHRRVAARYLEVRDRLAKANLKLNLIRMDARGSFLLELAGGISVRIGHDEEFARRIDRFFRVVVPSLEPSMDRVAYIDLRYPNGFAVGWRDRARTDPGIERLGNIG